MNIDTLLRRRQSSLAAKVSDGDGSCSPTNTLLSKSLYTALALLLVIGPLLSPLHRQSAAQSSALRGSAAAGTSSNIIHSGGGGESSTLFLKQATPNYLMRTTPLDPAEKFSFVHISKCAGSTWIRLFMDVLKLNIFPRAEAGPEHSVAYQQNYACKDANYTLISLRSPRHHVYSSSEGHR